MSYEKSVLLATTFDESGWW